ncbi:helix-turn-helix transcriptional regulator [Longibaculum muris]|uniref:helix-turn-helix domain-containing protein n=1 Tax=Longibaculum muris TaxID=1796628 RepID=UPI002943BDB1|nr:helix-turn-helix transcriptional regulator [Longibaculum muris]
MAFSDFMHDLRERNQLTQAQVAELLGVNINTIKQIEANKIKAPSMRVLDSFCEYLNEDRLTVMYKILFRRDENVKCDDEFTISQSVLVSKFMTYMYLEGWNIDEVPVIYKTKDIGELIYAGQLTKKREPNNKVVITSISAYYDQKIKNICKEEAIRFITSSLAAFFCIDSISLKGMYVVFDNRYKNQREIFKTFEKLELNKIPFNYQLILFDPDKGDVVNIKDLRM